MDSNYNTRPEWYFLFLFQALKFFPGEYEAVAAVVLPALGIAVLFLVPLLDYGPGRHPLDRLRWTSIGLAAITGFGYLTYSGYTSPLTNPTIEKDPLLAQGRRLFTELKCAYCHKVAGKGGDVGPALDGVTGHKSEQWLARHLQDPRSNIPDSNMPRFNLLDDEIRGLVVYLKSLDVGTYSKAAPRLFAENCTVCHKVYGEGGDSGPDLSSIGSGRDQAFIKSYIADPVQVDSDSIMPGFKGQLSQAQIDDIAKYLASLKGR